MNKTFVLLGIVLLLPVVPSLSQEPLKDETLKSITDRIIGIEYCAVAYSIQRPKYKDQRGEIVPAFKKVGLYARGPLKMTATEDRTLRISEEFMVFGKDSSSTHSISFYNGKEHDFWNALSRTFQAEPRFNQMKFYQPPHYALWLENVLVYPLHLFLTMQNCHVLARENKATEAAKGNSVELTVQMGPEGRLKHRIEFDPAFGMKRVEQISPTENEIVVDEFREVNGIRIPESGRMIFKDNTVRMKLFAAKLNDQVSKESLVLLDVPTASDEDPTYFTTLLDLDPSVLLQQLGKAE